MLASELIDELKDCIKKFGDVEVVKTRAGLPIDHVYIYGVKILLEAEEEYIGDYIVRFDIDYAQKDKLCTFVAENNLLKLLFDYRNYGKVSLFLEPKTKKEIRYYDDNFYKLKVDILVDNLNEFKKIAQSLEKQNIKDVEVNLKYEV